MSTLPHRTTARTRATTTAPARAAAALAALATSLALVAGAGAQAQPAQAPTTAGPAAAQTTPAAPAAGGAPPAKGAAATAQTPEMIARMQKLAGELRCLVCQNQTLADSHAELAVELRREVEAMMLRGDSDEQIKTYLVDRYGDFVLYRPPVQGNTALLWFGPFALLLIGAIAWLVVQRRSRRAAAAIATQDEPAAADLRQRTRHLLED